MTWHKLSPAVLTLLVFLLAQGLGTLLIFGIGMFVSPEFNEAVRAYISGETPSMPLLDLMSVSTFSITLMAVDILAVLGCYCLLHNIRPVSPTDIAAIHWRPGVLAIAGGIFGALSISVVTETIEAPDIMQQMTLAMSHNILGLLTIAIVGPITEELLFREAIEGEMLRRGANPWTAILVSAIAFGTAHLNLAQGLYAFPLAILFGIIYFKTGNIVLTSLLHILNNSIVALQLLLLGQEANNLTYADWLGGTAKAYLFMALCAIICIILMKHFWKHYPTIQKTQKKAPP